jgi:hypothetical protein
VLYFLHSDYGINSNTKIRIRHINRLLIDSKERLNNKMAWDMWVQKYPLMLKQEIETEQFEQFKSNIFKKTQKYTDINNIDIEKEFDEIVDIYKKRGD